jgi:predicted MFS family arabinose efflux permease
VPATPSADVAVRRIVLGAAALRSAVSGYLGVTLGLYLAALGEGPGTVGLVVGAGFAGNALTTLAVAVFGDRWGRRRTLLAVCVLSAAGLAAIAAPAAPALLAVAALAGAVNGMGRDRGAAQTLDQSVLASRASGAARTRAFVWYTLAQDVGAALGSVAAAGPSLFEHWWGLAPVGALRVALLAAAAVTLLQGAVYARLPRESAPDRDARAAPGSAVTRADRRRVAGLAGLFVLDSLGGGFLAGAILSYWFFRRFAFSAGVIGLVFAAGKLLNAASYLAADALARRIGLLRTMVYTHLPSSLVLAVLPWIGAPGIAVALFLVRESLVQMDVPARQAYVTAVVAPSAHTFALGVTSVARYAGWAVGPALAGLAMGALGLGAPLLIAAGLKSAYDVALFVSYREVRPEGEAAPLSAA